MSSHNPVGTEIVIRGCKKWPDLPSRTLARKLFNENKGVWTNLEACRCAVQWRRGRNVKWAGGMRTRTQRFSEIIPSSAPTRAWNPRVYIPPSDEQPFLPHVVEVDKDTRALVLGDIHIPYHSVSALRATLQEGKRQDCKVIFLNGDTLDFHKLSRFEKDFRARDPKGEVAAANELLDSIDDMFPKALKIWKDGNHDERYGNQAAAVAPEVWDLAKDLASLDKLLELDSRGWEYVSLKRIVMLGRLPVLHGHEYPTPLMGPVNAARGLFLRSKACAMVNHHHQTSEHTEPDILDNIITTWSLGCLCDLHPYYARFNKWNHGAAVVELGRKGSFHVRNFRIQNGKLLN